MTKHLAAIFLISLAMSSPDAGLHAAQKNKPVPSAPIPAPILSAVRVFIANGGGDESRFDPQYTGGPDRLGLLGFVRARLQPCRYVATTPFVISSGAGRLFSSASLLRSVGLRSETSAPSRAFRGKKSLFSGRIAGPKPPAALPSSKWPAKFVQM
jgi:hypothetical protein